jgi:CHAD domain-containing protein
VARPTEVEGFDCEESFARSAARVLEARTDDVLRHAPGVLDLSDAERVHDMRVATRRLRAALEMFEPCFPRRRYRRARKRIKALADALGERRDRDVAIERLEGFLAGAQGGDRGRLEILIARLHQEQEAANRSLAPLVAEERLAKLRRRLARLAAGVRG